MFVSASGALLCMALNVYFEARGEIIPGQYAVALVTMNRAKVRENVCAEVFSSKQFSWTNAGVKKVKGGWQLDRSMWPDEDHAWYVANRVAHMTLQGRMYDITHGANHYHTRAVNPVWKAGVKPVKKIGAHVFYKLKYRSRVTVKGKR